MCYVYILICEDGSYYTGFTQDLKARLEKHLRGEGSRYTRMKRPERIVYVEWFKTRSEAMRREREIKRLTHKEKSLLISKREGEAKDNLDKKCQV